MARKTPVWLVAIGAALVIIGVPIQAFTIVAYVRGAGEGALDAHGLGSLVVHIGELLVVIGAIWAWRKHAARLAAAVAFLVLSIAQMMLIGDTEKQGGWVNGLHGMFAILVLIAALVYFDMARRSLGARHSAM